MGFVVDAKRLTLAAKETDSCRENPSEFVRYSSNNVVATGEVPAAFVE